MTKEDECHTLATPEVMESVKQQAEGTLELVKNPDFFTLIIKEIQEKKVVGEADALKAILLITNVRNVKNASPTSSNLHANDVSGIGKDHICKALLDMIKDDKKVIRTKITPEVFTYWHNAAWEPEWTWDGKIFYLEDVSSAMINSDVFKVFSSGGSHATVVIKQKAIDIKINGKPSMLITSYGTSPNHENLRRYPIVYLDPSKEQTEAILIRQSEDAERNKKNEYDECFIQAIDTIKPVSVVIPYASRLPEFFPKNVIIRTNYKRFLDMIKSSASYYQYQRERDADGNIIATEQDYQIARDVFLHMMKNPLTIPLTRTRQEILDYFKTHKDSWFAVGDIEHLFPISDKWFRDELKFLHKEGFLLTDKKEREGVKQSVTVYKLNIESFILSLPERCSKDTIDKKDTFNTIDTKDSQSTDLSNESFINKTSYQNTTRTIESIEDETDYHNSSLLDKIMSMKAYVEHVIEVGHEGVSYTALIDHFPETLISRLIESGQLFKIPGKDLYRWGG